MSQGAGGKLGAAAREFWDDSKRKLAARVAHARGEITDAQLAAILGPPPPPGTSFADVVRAVRQAPEGTFVAMLRKSGQELLAAATSKRTRDETKDR